MTSQNLIPDTGIFFDRMVNQDPGIANEAGNQLALILAELAADAGFQDSFNIPEDFASGGKIVAVGLLDGAMSSVTLAVGITGLSLIDNESGDQAFSTQDLGSNNTDHADEDFVKVEITLSNLSVAAGDHCYYHFFIDISANDFLGGFMMTGLYFEYTTT